jgi:hypothetical protein
MQIAIVLWHILSVNVSYVFNMVSNPMFNCEAWSRGPSVDKPPFSGVVRHLHQIRRPGYILRLLSRRSCCDLLLASNQI